MKQSIHAIHESLDSADEDIRERKLVERSRQGDTEAFAELIEQHRSKARQWARRMTSDPYMADDIVQDALVSAFLHVGSLADAGRFLPWLHRIVRNQANMRLRRGGPYRREKPFAAWDGGQASAGGADWSDLDSIVAHLSRTTGEPARHEDDPEAGVLRKELYETIQALLHCLSKKERAIFESYFYQQLDPEEIAALYGMTTGSIYTYIYRSRQKLRKEQHRISLYLSPEQKGGKAMASKGMTILPSWPRQAAVKSSFIDAIGQMLAALGNAHEPAELMGMSGFAFRMKISDKTTFADGLYVFDWRQALLELMAGLGYKMALLCGRLSEMPVPLLAAVERFPVVLPIEEAVLPFIRKHIDFGKPVLYFDTCVSQPYVHEWSLIYGYDDEKRVVHVTDPLCEGGKLLPYDEIVYNPIRFLAAAQSEAEPMLDERAWTGRSLQYAVQHARSGCGHRVMTSYLSYTSGLAAYDRWRSHLLSEWIIPNRYGMGQLAAVYADARYFGARYLRRVKLEGESMRLALLASEAYEQAALLLTELSEEVPFIRSSEQLPMQRREHCAGLLERAKGFEAAAVGYLERAIGCLSN